MNKALLGSDFDVTERGYDSGWDDLDVGTGDDADIVDLLSDSGAALQHDENGMLRCIMQLPTVRAQVCLVLSLKPIPTRSGHESEMDEPHSIWPW